MSENLPAPTDPPPSGQVLIYQDGATRLQVRIDGQTVWLPQRLIADLYQVSTKTVNEHLVNIYDEGELDPQATIRKFRIVQTEGPGSYTSRRPLQPRSHPGRGLSCPLRAGNCISPMGYARLSELLVKGFTLDDERIKAGRTLGDDYFEELLARIRDIRSSERMFYQKITDIYATSIDYDPQAEITKTFFQTVQNKMHWRPTATLQPRSSADVPMRPSPIWDSRRGRMPQPVRSERGTSASRRISLTMRRSMPSIAS